MNNLIKITIIFFLVINTRYFWEGKLGVWGLFTTLILIQVYFVLVIALLNQFIKSFREKFSNSKRNILITLTSIILFLVSLKPNGIINFERFEEEDCIVAERESVANCRIKLQLKENLEFIENSYCFGRIEQRGNYQIIDDTIYFYNNGDEKIENFYSYGVIKKNNNSKGLDQILLFKDTSLKYSLFITKNKN